jgi:hypothetical protein
MQEMNILSTPKLKSKEEKYEPLNQEIHAGNPDPVRGKKLPGCGQPWQENLGAVLCCDNSRKISRNQPRCRRMKIDGVKEKHERL